MRPAAGLLFLVFSACPVDPGPADAGVLSDAGTVTTDAGSVTTDAGATLDAGASDSGVTADAGPSDALGWATIPPRYCRPMEPCSLELAPFVLGRGSEPLAFTVSAGTLPAGVVLDGGAVYGTPTIDGTVTFGLRVEDGVRTPATTSIDWITDGVAPGTPTGLTASNLTSTSVRLTWSASDVGSGVQGCRVLQDGVRITFVQGASTYDVTGLTPATSYAFSVRCFDFAQNGGPTSAPVQVTTLALASDAGSAFGPPPPSPITACTYFLSPTGDDTAAGSLSAPWRTLSQANRAVQPGQSVCFRAGTWDETLRPATSGTATQPITFAAYGAENVTIRGGGPHAVDLQGRQFVTLEQLRLDADKNGQDEAAVMLANSTGVIVRDCTVQNRRALLLGTTNYWRNPWGVIASRAVDVRLERNTISGWYQGVVISDARGAVVRDNVITNNVGNAVLSAEGSGAVLGQLIEGNLLGGSLASDGVQTDDYSSMASTVINVRGLVIRRNVIFLNAENGIDLKSAGDVLIEENLIVAATGDNDGHGFQSEAQWWLSRSAGAAIMHGSSRTAGRVVVRRNVFYDGTGMAQMRNGWHVFNNTFVNDNRDFMGSNSTWVGEEPTFIGVVATGTDSDFFNNVVVEHAHGAVLFWGAAAGAVWDHNLYFESQGAPRFLVRPSGADRSTAVQQVLDFAAFRAQLPSNLVGREANSRVADPQFVNVPARPVFAWVQPAPSQPVVPPRVDFGNARQWFPWDFGLSATSPAIDTGRHATTATNSGNASTTLQVARASAFVGPLGAAWPGDRVIIGNQPPVVVIDLTGQTLTLGQPRTWQPGDFVDLVHAGAAPDVGACERGQAMPLCALR